MGRFDYVKYDEASVKKQAEFKTRFESLESEVRLLESKRVDFPHYFNACIIKLDEAYMFIGKMLREIQIERNGGAELQEERKDS